MSSSIVHEPPHWKYVGKALEMMRYVDPYGDELRMGFKQHWGGYSLEALLRAVRDAASVEAEGNARYPDEPEERVFAIFAAAYTGEPSVRNTLAPFLQSTNYHERWAAALGLGYLQDERALPVLMTMLTEYLPPQLRYARPGIPEWRNEIWRAQVPQILASAWRRPAFVPPLRNALGYVLHLQRNPLPEARAELAALDVDVRQALTQDWAAFVDITVFALGRLGAFGALDGLELAPERLRFLQVQMIMGALQHQYAGHHFDTWREMPGLRDAVARGLTHEFGLSAEPCAAALAAYEKDELWRYGTTPSIYVDGWKDQ